MEKQTPEQTLEVVKAAHKSMHDHFNAIKAAASSHMAEIHGLVGKLAKLAGEPAFDEGKERSGGQELGGTAKPGTSDTVIKYVKIGATADGVEIFKAEKVAASEPTEAEKVAKAARKAEKKAAKQAFRDAVIKLASGQVTVVADKKDEKKDDVIVGDRKDIQKTGKPSNEDKVAKAAKDKELTALAGEAFSVNGKPGDPAKLNELYDKTVTRGPMGPGAVRGF